jgi:hypothetical protein
MPATPLGEGPAGKTLKVRQRGVAPPLGFVFLNGQKRRCLGVPLGIHPWCELRPGLAHLSHILNAAGVMLHEFIPKRGTGCHPIVPGQMMEPQQVHLRRQLRIVEVRRKLR